MFVHFKLRDYPLEAGTALTECVELALVLVGSCALFATQDPYVAGGCAAARVLVAWTFRKDELGALVESHDSILKKYKAKLAELDEAEKSVAKAVKKMA